MEGRSHMDARIANMNKEEKALLVQTLEKWLATSLAEEFKPNRSSKIQPSTSRQVD